MNQANNLLFSEYLDYYRKTKLMIAKQLAIVLTSVFLVLSFLFYRSDDISYVMPFVLGFIFCSFCLFHVYYFKKPALAYYLYITTGTITCTYTLFFLPKDLHVTDFLWRVIMLILSFIGTTRKTSLTILVYYLFEVTFYTQFFIVDNLKEFDFNSSYQLIGLNVEFVVLFSVIFYLMYHFIQLNVMAKEKLTESLLFQEKMNAELSRKNEENVVLVKEIHHRVKNNLQIIISLLRLQKDELKSEEAKQHFTEAINRIMSMSTIHQRLYQQENLELIDVDDYIRDMNRELQNIYANKKAIELKIDSQLLQMDLKTIVPFGLILNELLTNSFKHAFHENQEGIVSISLRKTDQIEFNFEDNGTWKEKETTNSSFGIELIEILTEQLDGTFSVEKKSNGTKYSFFFPIVE
jgi:two-component system, sensor histidine kinase PdtaS